jgi:hypothetical protein
VASRRPSISQQGFHLLASHYRKVTISNRGLRQIPHRTQHHNSQHRKQLRNHKPSTKLTTRTHQVGQGGNCSNSNNSATRKIPLGIPERNTSSVDKLNHYRSQIALNPVLQSGYSWDSGVSVIKKLIYLYLNLAFCASHHSKG